MKFKFASLIIIACLSPFIANAKPQTEYYPEDTIGVARIGSHYSKITGPLKPLNNSPSTPSEKICQSALPDAEMDTGTMSCSYTGANSIIYDIEGVNISNIHINSSASNIWNSKLPFGVRPNDTPAIVSAKIKKGGQIAKASKVDEPSYYNHSVCFYPKKNSEKYACFGFNRQGKLIDFDISNGESYF